MNPILSVIVPVYNTKRYIHRCIDSLVNQTNKDIEILLIDDGSTDGTNLICDEFAEKYENVCVIHKVNEGLGYARNTGLEYAKGKYVSFVDSDDYVEKNMYENLIYQLENQDADVAYCEFCYDKANGTKVNEVCTLSAGVFTGYEMLFYICGASPKDPKDFVFDMSVCKGVFKKSVIDKFNVRFISERKIICEDLVFDFDILPHANKVVFCKESYYHYCENFGSLTHKYIENRLNKEIELYQLMTKKIKENDKEEYQQYVNRFFLGRMRSCLNQELEYDKNSFKTTIKRIESIVSNTVIQSVLEVYPFNLNPWKQRIFNYSLQKRWSLVIYILLRLNKL